ncbi:putative baseplate J family protein [Gottschalkia acidurici 9a]|uniref:Baseplate J family protein n=1 Tax=Gottschalkia acidurici (strain ATCC 7906 / DSM 604 / BCRC 14475 / CIP 104303 / KCTC 5404 / NCIMB 10678 / 9a) TaxID=1128398 RepID=K0AXG6_GOTA9|nr:baseplate J/gp47 family protein [Gottschalkia acidurici]AFS78513.1 putative baseplate J family protein [Gottschalkia acidurici 9a]
MFKINFPSKEELTQVLVSNLVGSDKKIDDLRNQWFIKHLIIALRETIYMLVVMLKFVYDNLTAISATGEKLEEIGIEEGVYRKEPTKTIHSVTLQKSSPVTNDYPIADNFLLTTTPIGSTPPIQFRVKPGQGKRILAGQSNVTDVLVECTEYGSIGNVPSGAINLIAQAGLDEVLDSRVVYYGLDIEDIEVYRKRVLDKKKKLSGGGTSKDYKMWAESVEGVLSATVYPRLRGNGTVDILINDIDGMPTAELISKTESEIATKTPADLADGAILVTGGTPLPIDITLSNCIWANGYDLLSGKPIIEDALRKYINRQANQERVVKFIDIIAIAKSTYLESDIDRKPILSDFTIITPTSNITLEDMQTAVVGQILIT